MLVETSYTISHDGRVFWLNRLKGTFSGATNISFDPRFKGESPEVDHYLSILSDQYGGEANGWGIDDIRSMFQTTPGLSIPIFIEGDTHAQA